MNDSYTLEERIGTGELGMVYRARQQQEEVAIKLIPKAVADKESFKQPFLRDIRMRGRLHHQNLNVIRGVYLESGQLGYVMDYASAGSLQSYLEGYLAQNKLPPIDEAVRLIRQAADGLHYLHDQNIIHQDIKPTNVLLNGSPPQALLADAQLEELTRLASTSPDLYPKSSLPFIAPEVFSRNVFDVETDIYALGAVLYLLVTGRPPLVNPGASVTEAVRIHAAGGRFNRASHVRPGIPEDLDFIINKCLDRDPAKRYRTGTDLSHELGIFLGALAHQMPTVFRQASPVDSSTLVQQVTVVHPTTQYTQPNVGLEQVNQDRLIILGPNQPTGVLTINKAAPGVRLLIGRDPNADLQLDHPTVSRFHLRLEYRHDDSNGDYAYAVTDLGSANGVWILSSEGNRKVTGADPHWWPPGTFLRVGAYRLRIEPAENLLPTMRQIQAPDESQKTASEVLVPTVLQVPLELAVTLDPPDVIIVAPGETQTVRMSLHNRGKFVDHYLLSLRRGIVRPEWVTFPEQAIRLLEDESTIIQLGFHPPKESSSLAGTHLFEIIINGSKPTNLPKIVPGRLRIQPFYRFESDLYPKIVRKRARTVLTINNQSNTAQAYEITARDNEDEMTFSIPKLPIRLEAGKEQRSEIRVKPRSRPFIGGLERKAFEVMVKDNQPNTEPRTHNADVIIYPVIRTRYVILAGVLLVLLVLIFMCGVVLFMQRNSALEQRRAEGTATLQAAVTATARQVIISTATQAAVLDFAAATQAAVSATALAASDADGDGLSRMRELELGTDPDNPDTDGDNLSDGLEVNSLGTNPLVIDSDGDTLRDDVEVNTACLSPLNKDTDGDGKPDGVDTDPCQQIPPTAAPAS